MRKIKLLLLSMTLISIASVHAQNTDSLTQQIKSLEVVDDPVKSLAMMKRIIQHNGLQEEKDAETIDVMKGSVAMDYLDTGQYKAFDEMIASMRNRFNQTSYMNMGASNLIDEKKDLDKAETLAKRTLDLYLSYKDDPEAKPKSYSKEDWQHFMSFAYYPYCDTYANALFAVGKYKKALAYQEKAFRDGPQNGLPNSVERYAQLLVLNGQEEKAYSLLMDMAKTGKATAGMNTLLKKLYIQKNPDTAEFDRFFADLQANVVATLKGKYQKSIQDIEAPGFTLKDLEGHTVSLSDFRGQVVVIDFWATWCAPCKASFPAMQKVMKRHPEVKFLFIDTQEKPEGASERVSQYIRENKYSFHVLMDRPMADNPRIYEIVSAYQVTGIPTKFVIDANGRQRFTAVGFSSDTELINELEAMIQLAQEQGKIDGKHKA